MCQWLLRMRLLCCAWGNVSRYIFTVNQLLCEHFKGRQTLCLPANQQVMCWAGSSKYSDSVFLLFKLQPQMKNILIWQFIMTWSCSLAWEMMQSWKLDLLVVFSSNLIQAALWESWETVCKPADGSRPQRQKSFSVSKGLRMFLTCTHVYKSSL